MAETGAEEAEEGAADRRRDDALRRAAVSGVVSRLLAAGLAFISLGISARGLSTIQFGILSSLVVVYQIASTVDLGLGSGLIAALSRAAGERNEQAQRSALLSAAALMSVVGTVTAAVGVVMVLFTPVVSALTGQQGAHVVTPALLVVLFSGLGVPATLGEQVQIGLQEGARAVSWALGVAACSAAACGIAFMMHADLVWYALALVGLPVTIQVVQTYVELTFYQPWLRPRPGERPSWHGHGLAKTSGLYTAIALVSSVLSQSGVLVVAQALGPASAGTYQVATRMTNLIATTLYLGTRQFWPAATEALARRRFAWVRRRFFATLAAVMSMAALACAVLVCIGPYLARLWVGESLVPARSLFLAASIWCVYSVAMTQCSTLLNAAHIVRAQVVLILITGAVALGLSFAVTPVIGLTGPLWASLVGHLCFAGIGSAILCRRVLRRAAASALEGAAAKTGEV